MMTTTVTLTLLRLLRTYLEGFQTGHEASFLAGIDWEMAERSLEPKMLGCLAHLDRVAEIAPPESASLAGFLAEHRGTLCWGQTYTASDFGQDFIDNYGWLEAFGTRGHFANDSIAGGFLILGPGVLYPDHHHLAEEIYIPLTGGTDWRKGEAGFRPRAAGDVIHHPSNLNHAMRTGAEPLLALYLWRGGPLAQKPTIAV